MKMHFSALFLIISLFSSQLLAQSASLDAGFSKPVDLTDTQAKESKEFIHQGKKDRAYKEGCERLKKCDGSDLDQTGFMAIVEQNIGKAYAMLFGGMSFLNGSGGPKFGVKEKTSSATTEEATQKPKQEGKNDYCMYGAMAYETLAGFMQSNLQSKAQEKSAKISDPQLQSLVNLKETHKARKKTATYQAATYGAVSACYVVYGTTQGVARDWKYWAKLGGATALTTLYISKASKHGKAAGKVQKVIDSLPKSGECNPWTESQCFCDEPTSKDLYPMQYEEVCTMNNGNFDTPKVAMGCGTMVNGAVEFDKQCKCKQTNTCFTAQLKSYNPSFNLGKNFMNQANQGFDLLSSGEFDQAKLDRYSTNTASMAKKILDKAKINAPAVKLNDDQKITADAFDELVPAPLAALAAVSSESSPPAGGLMKGSTQSALDKLPESVKQKVSDISVNYKSKGSASKVSSNSGNEFEFKMPGQVQSKKNSNEVIRFAEKALSKADVSNAPDTPIFDIISNRYRRSGWTKLQAEEKAEIK